LATITVSSYYLRVSTFPPRQAVPQSPIMAFRVFLSFPPRAHLPPPGNTPIVDIGPSGTPRTSRAFPPLLIFSISVRAFEPSPLRRASLSDFNLRSLFDVAPIDAWAPLRVSLCIGATIYVLPLPSLCSACARTSQSSKPTSLFFPPVVFFGSPQLLWIFCLSSFASPSFPPRAVR